MAENGYDIIAVYRNNDIEASAFSSKIEEKDRNCKLYKADLSNEEERLKIVNDIKQNNYRLKALVNNAGVYRSETLDSINLKDWERVIRLNETVPILMTKEGKVEHKLQVGLMELPVDMDQREVELH